MAAAQLAPGVEIVTEPAPSAPAGIATDVAGFAGYAARGPAGTPVAVSSWRDFASAFGGASGPGHLPAVVRGFFENGGRRCWVVRVTAGDPGGAAAAAGLATPGGAWRLRASSPGTWGDGLFARLVERHPGQSVLTAAPGTGDWSFAARTAGFERGMLVRLTQDGAPAAHRVLSDVDAIVGRLVWVNERPALRLPGERALSGFDPARPVLAQAVEFTLAATLGGVPVAVTERLAPLPAHPRYGPAVLAATATAPVVLEELRPVPEDPDDVPAPVTGPLAGGRDGLALVRADDFVAAAEALDAIDEVALLAAPDVHARPVPPPVTLPPRPSEPCCGPAPDAPPLPPPAGEQPPRLSAEDAFRVQADLVERCERRRDRMALVEAPPEADASGALAWRARLDSSFAALYHPWVRRAGRPLPPTGHVTGQYARAEREQGIQQAPANVALADVDDVVAAIDPDLHGRLNAAGVNVLRSVPGRGVRVLGARTLERGGPFRFVPVRRLVIQVRRAVDHALQWTVFEPNADLTHVKVALTLTSYLAALWQRGALAGERAEEAFFVRCDRTLTTEAERADGRMVAEVGVAPVAPYEFVRVRVWRVGGALEMVEEPA